MIRFRSTPELYVDVEVEVDESEYVEPVGVDRGSALRSMGPKLNDSEVLDHDEAGKGEGEEGVCRISCKSHENGY